ncbi:MAG: MBL fold metallo-hydrolase [Candidatus Woesearchaeota archaeon]|nr:MAG: MBL fold metallo-hydrolase [Candidatus Woesearchaeota archaeon]
MVEPYLKIGDITIEWLGHATFRIKSKRTVIYVDPFVLDSNAEKADFILVSHEHYDHCDDEKIKEISKEDTIIIGPPSCISKIMGNLKVMHPGDKLSEGGVTIRGIPSYNVVKPFHPKDSGGLGFVVDFAGIKIYHAGDTDKIPEMEELANENITVALLPIGGTYTMDEESAAEAVKMIQPMMVVPMHYGATPQITLDADLEKFKELVGNTAEVRILERRA